jgi:AraC-like DNA-binding protein
MHLGRMRRPGAWEMPDHAHDTHHQLVAVLAGEIETVMSGSTTIAGPGTVKFHPRGVPHAERLVGGGPIELICISWREAEGTDYSRWPAVVADGRGRMRQLMEWMLELAPARDAGAQVALDSAVSLLAHSYAAAGADDGDAMVASVRAWVREHLAEEIYLDDLAEVAGMDRFRFSRAFARASGRTPMRFVRELRVEAVRTLAMNTTLRLREIAPQVGFADEFQLSRVFREVTGQSLSKLRRGR